MDSQGTTKLPSGHGYVSLTLSSWDDKLLAIITSDDHRGSYDHRKIYLLNTKLDEIIHQFVIKQIPDTLKKGPKETGRGRESLRICLSFEPCL